MTKEIYITPATCEIIRKGIENKQMSYKNVAQKVNTSPSTISRICNKQVKRINLDVAQKLETTLDILIINALDDTQEVLGLLSRMEELEKENKILKKLLIDKWQQ